MKYAAILLAAGKSTRYKETKQDIIFHEKPIWRYPYETIVDVIGKKNIIVVGKDVKGGETRTESVINGLKALSSDVERVVIVEAARPMVTTMQIKQLLESDKESVTFVKPLVNTVMYRNGTYINREELCELLTPQAFDYKMLVAAYESGRFMNMTDETRVMFEYYGVKPHFIETESNLFKITYPGDLDVIESIYQNKRNEEGV